MSTTSRPRQLAIPPRPVVHPVLRHTSVARGTALSWLGNLPRDSRASLPLKETEVASFGMTWAIDLTHETELAQELATARLRRTHGSEGPKDH